MLLKSRENSQENTCARAYFLIKSKADACSFIEKENLAQVFFCEFCKFFKKIFFKENFR